MFNNILPSIRLACFPRCSWFGGLGKSALSRLVTHITTRIHFNLESRLQELRDLVDNGIGDVSVSVKEMFTNEMQKKSRASRLHSSRKVFVPQESPLSKMLLYDDENYKTLSNIFAVCLMLWGSAMFLDDMDQLGYPNFDLMIWGVFNDVIPFFRIQRNGRVQSEGSIFNDSSDRLHGWADAHVYENVQLSFSSDVMSWEIEL